MSYKRHLRTHLQNTDDKQSILSEIERTTTDKFKIFKCKLCDKGFSSRKNMNYHINHSCKNNSDIVGLNKIKDILKTMSDHSKVLNLLNIPNQNSISTVNHGDFSSNVINSTDVKLNNNNINVDINVNNYGNENLEHISLDKEDISPILLRAQKLGEEKTLKEKQSLAIANDFFNAKIDRESVQRDRAKIWRKEQKQHENRIAQIDSAILECIEDILVDFFEKIHIDEDHPENHNIYIPNMKSHNLFFIMKESWKRIGNLRFLQKNTETYYNYLIGAIDFLIENTNNEQERQKYLEGKSKIEEFYSNSDNKIRLEKSVAKKFYDTAYQNKEILKKTYDTTKE